MTVPFPGESIGCADGWSSDGLGYNLYKEVWLRGTGNTSNPTPGHRVITSGVWWDCWAYNLDRPYLEAADDATPLTVAWVFEVLSGSGTLALSDYPDAAWDYATGVALPNSLGTLTITGPGTYVVPTGSFSNAYLRQAGFENGPAQLAIECTAGSIDVQQVKLRVWPVGGPLGAFTPDTYTDPGLDRYPSLWWVTAAGAGTTPPDQATMRANLAASTYGALNVVSNPAADTSLANAGYTAYETTDTHEQSFGGGSVFAVLRRNTLGLFAVPPGVEGVDWVRNPSEVQYEYDSSYLYDEAGATGVSWLNGGAVDFSIGGGPLDPAAYVDPQTGGSTYFNTAEVDALPVPGDPVAAPGTGSSWVTFPDDWGLSGTRVSRVMPEFADDKYLLIVAWCDAWLADQPISSGTAVTMHSGQQAGTFVPLQYHWQPAPFRYWNPTAVRRRPLRQWPLEQGDGGSPRRYSRDALSSYGSSAPRRYGAGYQ